MPANEGVGAMIRTTEVKVLLAANGCSKRTDRLLIEMQAVEEGLEVAVRHGIKKNNANRCRK